MEYSQLVIKCPIETRVEPFSRSSLNEVDNIRCGGPTTLSYPSSNVKKCRSSLSSITSGYTRHPVFSRVSARDIWVPWHMSSVTCANWHSRVWQTRTFVRTYVHCKNRSLIQSLAIIRSAITCTNGLAHNLLTEYCCECCVPNRKVRLVKLSWETSLVERAWVHVGKKMNLLTLYGQKIQLLFHCECFMPDRMED